MTDWNRPPSQDHPMLRSADHDRDLKFVTAPITKLERPTEHLLRVSARIPDDLLDAEWDAPNVTLRLELGERFEGASRVSTVRRYLPDSQEIEVDVVMHGTTGVMMMWASEVAVGDPLVFRGPRQHFVIPAADADRPVALFLDCTAIPALYSILVDWTPGRTAIGWVETDDADAFAELPQVEGVTLSRIAPGIHGDGGELMGHARGLDDPARYVVWAAGERDDMRSLRRFFRSEVGLGKDEANIFGYWKQGVTNTEIDNRRLAGYQKIVSEGGSLEDFDDLTIGV